MRHHNEVGEDTVEHFPFILSLFDFLPRLYPPTL
jgi:hypothetical protein